MTGLDPRERQLVDAIAGRLAETELGPRDRAAVVQLVESTIDGSDRRPQVQVADGATRVHPRLVAQLVAAVVREHRDPTGTSSVPVVLDEATPMELVSELRRRLGRLGPRVARPPG
ncbi:MAG: hypothetical protein Q7T56_11645 [Nocardioidaceae bacterium]|nr:hypothetical protein [Nocardioidaceae bacterium]